MTYRSIKTILDIFAGVVLTIATLPIVILLMILVVLESKGPPIFKQQRVGLNGQLFTIYKIRSMTFSPNNSGTFFTSTNDSRITKIGYFLRKTSLDEFPQFWNLLLGQMSLIGPRPNVPQQRSLYSSCEWDVRNSVKPGITGLAQSTFRSLATEKNRTRLDLFYARKYNLPLDLIILKRTLQILFKKGVQN